MPSLFYLLIIIIIGLLGSAWSVVSLLKNPITPYGLEVSHWRADPKSGSINGDPYQKIRTAISGALPLNANESVTFTREIDENEEPLQLNCTYRMGSEIANARFWTLTMVDKDGQIIKPNWNGANALYSQNLLFDDENRFSLIISRNPHPGNWLPISEPKPAQKTSTKNGSNTDPQAYKSTNPDEENNEFQLVLRMYDTPIISNNVIFEIKLPEVEKIGCAS